MRERLNIWANVDWVLVGIYLILVIAGWLNIYAAVYNEDHASIFDVSQSYGKQMIWIGVSIFLALMILVTDAKFFSAFSYFIYVFFLLMLVAVLFFGSEVKGSKSWFGVGDYGMQPSEFAKFATALAIARYLGSLNVNFETLSAKLIASLLVLIPAGLVLLQGDTGSALVFGAFILVFYREGLSGNFLILFVVAVALFLLTIFINEFVLLGIITALGALSIFLIKRNLKNILKVVGMVILIIGFIFSVEYLIYNVLKEHQRTRIMVLVGKEIDLRGAGYNVHQSKIAIGSGGFAGKGFLQGTQTKYNFVPEQSTDFIFCTVGEEWGFLGSIFVLAAYLALLIRLVLSAERQRASFSRVYGYGVVSILFFHFLINIGMTLGLIPVIGIPLPFFSYGGSGMIAFTILLFVFIKLDSNRLQLV
jgi:rod shape determining protein RodA